MYKRQTYNKAVDDGLAEEKPRLFRHVYTGVKANTIVHGFVVDASQGTHISGDSVPGTSLVAQVVLKLFQA